MVNGEFHYTIVSSKSLVYDIELTIDIFATLASQLFSIFSTLLHTLPILGTLGDFAIFVVALILGCVCFCGVTAVAYIRYRPVMAFGILAVAGIITGLCFWKLGDAADHSLQPTMQPVASPKFILFDDVVEPELVHEDVAMEYY